jgi:Tol biopolymer transport system component
LISSTGISRARTAIRSVAASASSWYDTLSVSRTGRVAYVADAPNFGDLATGLYSTSLAEAPPRLLVEPSHDAQDTMPAWSPDGKDLAYVRDAGTGEPGIQSGVLALVGRGGGPRQPPKAVGASPAFSPDGRWLVSTRDTDFEVNALTVTDSHLGHAERLDHTGDIRALGTYSSIFWLRAIP